MPMMFGFADHRRQLLEAEARRFGMEAPPFGAMAAWIVGDLFHTYLEDPDLLPANVRARFDEEGRERAVADHIACMTDRYATAEHRKLLGPDEPV